MWFSIPWEQYCAHFEIVCAQRFSVLEHTKWWGTEVSLLRLYL
jgi:hypothetical protein